MMLLLIIYMVLKVIKYIFDRIIYIQMQLEDSSRHIVAIVLNLDRQGTQIYRKKFGRKLIFSLHHLRK